jgi:hypothetical protein
MPIQEHPYASEIWANSRAATWAAHPPENFCANRSKLLVDEAAWTLDHLTCFPRAQNLTEKDKTGMIPIQLGIRFGLLCRWWLMLLKDLLGILRSVAQGHLSWNRYVVLLAWLRVFAGLAFEQNLQGALHGSAAASLVTVREGEFRQRVSIFLDESVIDVKWKRVIVAMGPDVRSCPLEVVQSHVTHIRRTLRRIYNCEANIPLHRESGHHRGG